MLTAKTGVDGIDYLMLENGNLIPVEGRAASQKYDGWQPLHAKSIQEFEQKAKELLIPMQVLGKADPERANLLKQQLQANNAFSDVDQNVSVNSVKLYIRFLSAQSDPKMLSYKDDRQQVQHVLMITSSDYERIGKDPSILPVIAHEIGHANYKTTDPNLADIAQTRTMQEKRTEELNADRYAGVKLADFLLSVLKNDTKFESIQHGAEQYRFDDRQSDHPNIRTRISALLEQEYGNKIFANSGEFDENGVFQPKRDANDIPITEDGHRVVNWDSELAPAIEAQVATDLTRLDQLIDSGRFTEASKDQFLTEVQGRIEKFRQTHPAQLESNTAGLSMSAAESNSSASNITYQQLADLFRQHGSDPRQTIALLSSHPQMSQAVAAFEMAMTEIGRSGMHSATQEKAIQLVQEKIASGIEQGNFPPVNINSQREQHAQTNMPSLEYA